MAGLALSPPCGFGKLRVMKKEADKQRLKREIAAVMRSMDFVSGHPSLAKGGRGREAGLYAGIYRQLALAWEHLALQCRHWDGFKKKRGGVRCCPICGLVEGMEEPWLLLPRNGTKAIGQRTRPTSAETFASKKAATVLDDTVAFHGAKLRVAVANPYRSDLFRDLPITVAAHRTVTLSEDGFECGIVDRVTFNGAAIGTAFFRAGGCVYDGHLHIIILGAFAQTIREVYNAFIVHPFVDLLGGLQRQGKKQGQDP